MTEKDLQDFNAELFRRGSILFREMPWRQTTDPYKIMVSEVMLQQTQVTRVIEKYREFILRFPTITDLANATLSDVLSIWIGLGYNRRARFLKLAAEKVVGEYAGILPSEMSSLCGLPGIGINTAKAILVYSTNHPYAFVETNVRTVFIHHFFSTSEQVTDKEILALVEQTMDRNNPRAWFWSIMDYGSWLKREHGNLSRQSNTYARQSKFEGSHRQKRASILKLIVERRVVTVQEIAFATQYPQEIIGKIIEQLVNEGFVVDNAGVLVCA